MSAPEQLPLALKLRAGSSLESFIPEGNELLLAALNRLENGGSEQLFIWGEQGSGRSHLLEAKVRQAGAGGFYLPAAQLDGLSAAVLEGLEQFDLVAVDDIDYLAGRPDWEAALFHLYNRVRDAGKSVLFSASAPPGHCGFTLPDLASRLAAGPVWRVLPLAEDGLMALVRQLGRASGLEVGDDVARYLISRGTRSAAAVVGLMERLDRHAMARQRRLTIPFVRSLHPGP